MKRRPPAALLPTLLACLSLPALLAAPPARAADTATATASASGPGSAAKAPRKRRRWADESDPETGFVDPRRRTLPRRHRFRLGVEFFYVRLNSVRAASGETQRNHLAPIGLDLAYQVQFAKVLMTRLSFALAVNAANTNTAMPVHIHPKIHAGYQGKLVGVAIGYGYFTPVYFQADAIDPVRGGLEQAIVLNNHHIDLELSFTTRVDRGALSFILRGGAVNTQLWNLDQQGVRSWRPMFTGNFGWFFGESKRAKERRAARRKRRGR